MFDVSALNQVLDKRDSLNEVLESSTPTNMLRDLPSIFPSSFSHPPPPRLWGPGEAASRPTVVAGWISRANIQRRRFTCPDEACLCTVGGWRDPTTAHYPWSPGLEPYCCRESGLEQLFSSLAQKSDSEGVEPHKAHSDSVDKRTTKAGTFVAEVVPAASSVAVRTGRAWRSVFVGSVAPPVAPGKTRRGSQTSFFLLFPHNNQQ